MISTTVVPDLGPVTELRKELALLEEKVLLNYTLADAIREGSGVTSKLTSGYLRDDSACAMGAGWIAARARGFIPEVTR